jgi:hypothetical protein
MPHVRSCPSTTDSSGSTNRTFGKRESLSHETEVPVLIQESQSTDEVGKSIQVCLECVIATVVPSPFAPPCSVTCWKRPCGDYGVSGELGASDILADAFF